MSFDAEMQICNILTEYPNAKPIIHWYDGPEKVYKEFIKRGYMQTFGCETIRSKHIQSLLLETPHNLILAETDNPTAETWLSMQMGIKTVASEDEALDHIATYGSGHSESIVSYNETAQKKFQAMVDAACVYVNAPTSFTDGAQFGLGAEIGISTQKLGARGPMALEEITTYKWLITGNGQTRK